MAEYQSVFRRREVKYLLDDRQYYALGQTLRQRMVPDEYLHSSISNLYYDTPNFRLIRESLAKPKYKEKLRLRCYSVPEEDSPSFVEIKKKCGGVVYKRRACLPYAQAVAYLAGQGEGDPGQIGRELDWFLGFYGDLHPAMYLSYDRISLKGKEDESLRLTLDRNIQWRTQALDLSQGPWGHALLRPEQRLMEIKIQDAMPLWLAEALSRLGIFPTSFSKYGAAYQTLLGGHSQREEVRRYA